MRGADRLCFFLVLIARLADAQQPDSGVSVVAVAGRGGLSGVVVDSVADVPLRGATVQLIASDRTPVYTRTTLSDSLGRFSLDGLPEGRYLLGFLHPMLDSLGLEPPVRDVVVRGTRVQRVDLAIPSAARIHEAVCAGRGTPSSGIVMGFARDARDASAAPGVTITGEWHELSFTSSGVVRTMPRVVTETAENGWFALCGVPKTGLMALTASRGADSSGLVEIEIPAGGFARREMYIASAPMISGGAADSIANPAERRVRRGNVRLHGTVRRLSTGEPIVGARVGVVEGPTSTTNGQGEWVLANAPAGTRMLEVRAVGLYPERLPVNVMAGAGPVHVEMKTFQAVLETINVRAGRLADHRGFQSRRRMGAGRYIEPSDYAGQHIEVFSDILRLQQSIRLERDSLGQQQFVLRGTGGIECIPDIYVDGQHILINSARDVDELVRPQRVRAIEIYSATAAPPQFQRAFGGCGSIVVWTR